MNGLAYRVPVCGYPVTAGWMPATPWELADGSYKRVWRRRGDSRVRTARVERSQGGWRWRVTERSARGIVTQIALGALDAVKPLPRMCFGAADLAARTR